MSAWKDIGSAPQDGTVILYRNKHTTAGACRWWASLEIAEAVGSPDPSIWKTGWYDADDPENEVCCPEEWTYLPE